MHTQLIQRFRWLLAFLLIASGLGLAAIFFAHDAGLAPRLWMGAQLGAAAFLVTLGLAVRVVRRSVLLWVGGALLFGPLGALVALYRLYGIVIELDELARLARLGLPGPAGVPAVKSGR